MLLVLNVFCVLLYVSKPYFAIYFACLLYVWLCFNVVLPFWCENRIFYNVVYFYKNHFQLATSVFCYIQCFYVLFLLYSAFTVFIDNHSE